MKIKEENIVKDASDGIAKDYGIYYLKDKKGKEWIRIKIYRHDFCLSLFDMPGEYTWEECKKLAEDIGYTLPSKKEWDIIDAYRDEIDKILEDYEGDELKGCYWSVSQSGSSGAWFYYAYGGRLISVSKYRTSHGRSLAYPSQLF